MAALGMWVRFPLCPAFAQFACVFWGLLHVIHFPKSKDVCFRLTSIAKLPIVCECVYDCAGCPLL